MVKKTINFSDAKILDDFDKIIIKKHGTIRGYRTETLELLMTDYATGNYDYFHVFMNYYSYNLNFSQCCRVRQLQVLPTADVLRSLRIV